MRVKSLFLVVTGLITLFACSHDAHEQSIQASYPQDATHIRCGSTPPLMDRTKLKQNLLKNGVITAEMTPEEADAKVAEYIRTRQKAFELCGKGNDKK